MTLVLSGLLIVGLALVNINQNFLLRKFSCEVKI